VIPALLAMLFWAPALFFGRVPIFRDFINTFIPYKLYAARAFASGRFPLWAPEPSLGAPFLGNYNSAVLYPPSAVVYALPNPVGVGLYFWLHFWVAGFGMSALARSLDLSRSAGIFGGIVYVFGGYLVSAAPTYLPGAAWAPSTIAVAIRLGSDPTPARFIQLVALLTLQLLGGTPESFPQVSLLVLGGALFARGVTPFHRRVALVAAAGALSVGLAAVQLCPTVEYFLQTTRATGLTFEESMLKSLQPQTLWTLVFPHRLNGGVVEPMVDRTLGLWWSIYVGIVPLLLIVISLSSRKALVWVTTLAVALALSMGQYAQVFPFFHQHVPLLFASFRYPEKFFLIAHLSLAVLASIGFSRVEDWLARTPGRTPGLVTIGLCLITVADLWEVHFPSLLFTEWDSLLRSAPPEELIHLGAEARIFQYERNDGGLEIWAPKFSEGSDLAAIERYTWSEVTANVGLVYGLGFVNGLDSFRRRSVQQFYDRLASSQLPECLQILRVFAVRFLMGEVPLSDPGLVLVRRGGPGKTWIYRLLDPAPRAYLATSVQMVGSVGEALQWLVRPAFVPGVDVAASGAVSAKLAGGSARIVEAKPEQLVLETDSAGEGLLVVNDSFFPGWLADVDGAPTDIVRVNGLVRGVPVPPGKHRIVMRYAPRSIAIGLALSLASLILLYPASRWLTRSSSRGHRLHGSRS
jgi:Bacterial membrane protein YfhO